MRSLRLLGVALTLCGSGSALATEDADLAAARAILLDFDRAWNAGDLTAITSAVAPSFGCEFYGGIGAEQFSRTLQILKDQLGDSNCTTHVERLVRHGSVIQAQVCREFIAAGESHGSAPPRETQHHIVYLRADPSSRSQESRLDAPLQVVALEEFDPAATEACVGDRFDDRRAGLAFALPPGMFIVAEPRFDGVVRVVLRSDDLHAQIRLSLDLFADPFELEPAFDHDLREWQGFSSNVDVERRRSSRVAGFPALRADGTYRGGACSLQPTPKGELLERVFTRVYCQPDPKVLLALHLDADARIAKRMGPLLESLLESVRFDAAEDASYGAGLAARLGYGPIVDGSFSCAESRLEVVAPLGFTLDRIPGPGCFALRATAPKGGATVTIEAMALLQPECDPGLIAEFDDQVYLDRNEERATSDPRLEHSRVTIGQLSGVRAERIEGRTSRERRTHVAFYVVNGDYLLVIDSTASDPAAARTALDLVVRGISIVE